MQKDKAAFLEKLMATQPEHFKSILSQKDSLRVQIVYTQINRNKNNKPSFNSFYFNQQPASYFYPASTVKMPIAFLALEKLNELNIPGLNMHTTMLTGAEKSFQTEVFTQPTSIDSRPTIANYIQQIFLVSDNDAFNRLYEFLGQEYIQKKLADKGYTDAVIRHRLQVSMNAEQHRYTNPVRFYDTTGKLIYEQQGVYSNAVYPNKNISLGKGFYKSGKLVKEPFSFSDKNDILLKDLHTILQSVLFPEAFTAKKRFRLTNEDLVFLKQWMSAYPKESTFPNYLESEYWDTYCKFLLYGSEKVTPNNNIRIFNKVGDAYGFLTDIAYIVDFEKGIEFMVSATILCNSDGIFNDNNYDYDSVGFPFMKNLGKLLYDYESKRKKRFQPDLKTFEMKYAIK
ncbi:MAG: serine hydrolase [Chitinophagaceae bacterium]